MFPEWIEVFAAGKWTDSNGGERDWTLSDLKEIADSYDYKTTPAPIVIGHPETDSPAYGWVEALKVEGEKLLAKPGQLVEEFKDWVKRGLYKRISVALYPDLTLKHIGFLGGAAPAVKGLAPVSFNNKAGWIFESDLQNIAVAEGFSLRDSHADIHKKPADAKAMAGKGGIKMNVKEWLEKMKGLFTEAEKGLSPDTVTDPVTRFTEADIQAAEKKAKDLMFAEVERERKEKEAAQAKLKEFEDEKQKAAASARKAEIHAFCEGLCKEGKLTPALRKVIEPVMIHVGAIHELPVIEFSEGVKKSALDGIKDFLAGLGQVVTFKEVTPKDGPGAGGNAGEKLSALTKKKMEEKKDLSYSAAFAEAQRENPDLAREIVEEMKGGREKK
jgi:hypothetical protein